VTDRPWESEPDSLEFEAEGLPCAMIRNDIGVWCGYVGVDSNHPLFGLPTNHPLRLPASWFENRRGFQGAGVLDVFVFALSGAQLDEACPISLAFEVHGGVNYANDHVPCHEPDERWWFGFDCSHAGDRVPRLNVDMMIDQMIETMPEKVRDIMRNVCHPPTIYRDQSYVVSECQSLAAQLISVAKVIEKIRV
jgi:hypothetical protein